VKHFKLDTQGLHSHTRTAFKWRNKIKNWNLRKN